MITQRCEVDLKEWSWEGVVGGWGLGSESVCVRARPCVTWCLAMELIESEIVSG